MVGFSIISKSRTSVFSTVADLCLVMSDWKCPGGSTMRKSKGSWNQTGIVMSILCVCLGIAYGFNDSQWDHLRSQWNQEHIARQAAQDKYDNADFAVREHIRSQWNQEHMIAQDKYVWSHWDQEWQLQRSHHPK